MTASLHTHVQHLDDHGHRLYVHVPVTVPAGDPRRRKPTVRQRRVYGGRVPVVAGPERPAGGQHRAPDVPAVRLPFDSYRRRATYVRQNGHLGDFTPAQKRRIDHKDNRDELRAEKAAE